MIFQFCDHLKNITNLIDHSTCATCPISLLVQHDCTAKMKMENYCPSLPHGMIVLTAEVNTDDTSAVEASFSPANPKGKTHFQATKADLTWKAEKTCHDFSGQRQHTDSITHSRLQPLLLRLNQRPHKSRS